MTRTALRAHSGDAAKLRPQRLLLEPVATDRIDLAGPPPAKPGQLRTLVTIYRNAGFEYGIDWRVLAAINRVETNLGQNTHVSSAGAVGWMQFLPSTWRRWGVDASGDGIADPYDPQDAIFSAARYLDAAGARGDIRRAIFAYNHANWYVNEVLRIAASLPDDYGDERGGRRARCRRRARSSPTPTAHRRARRPPACALGAPRAAGGRRPRPSGSARARPPRARSRRVRQPWPCPPARVTGSRATRARPLAPSARAAPTRRGTPDTAAAQGARPRDRCRARTRDTRRPRARARPGRRTCRPPALRGRR